MAAYIELVPLDTRKTGGGATDGRRRAGTPDVRRPFRGLERKEDTYAYFRVVRADGSPLKLTDSSAEGGEGPDYANFLLQSVQEARMERQQIIETFGAPYVFFFGESPRFIDISAVLIDSDDFNWHAEWWENYQRFFRGTRLAEMGCTALLHYDDVIVEGYPVQASSVRQSSSDAMAQLQMRMFVTNYMNVSNIGSPMYPIKNNAVIPDRLNERDDRTFAFNVPSGADNANRAIVDAYMKRVAVQNIRNQISMARTIERSRELQRQYALEQLGTETDGANLLSVGKSFLQGAAAAARGDASGAAAASERIKEESRKALQLAQSGRPGEALELLKARRVGAALDALSPPVPMAPTLEQALRRALLYSAPSPGNDLTGFLQRIQAIQPRSLVTQITEPKRTFPLRSKIRDNYDEYTERAEKEAAERIYERTGTGKPVNSEVPSLGSAVEKSLEDSGLTPSPDDLHAMNLYPEPLIKIQYGAYDPRDPSSFPPGLGPDRFTYDRYGGTPGAGGSYGGLLGGAAGPGYAGQQQESGYFFKAGSGLPQGGPYGNSNLPPSFYTNGYGPAGKPIYQKDFGYGAPPDPSTLFGGGPHSQSVQDLPPNAKGKGCFAVLVVKGDLL